MNVRILLGFGLCLIFTGCDDSKNPLSDPTTSKPDERLIGVWRLPNKDGVTYYHVGQGHSGNSTGQRHDGGGARASLDSREDS